MKSNRKNNVENPNGNNIKSQEFILTFFFVYVIIYMKIEGGRKMDKEHKSNYVAYHLHSDFSLLDSTTKFEDYVIMASSLGQRAICFTEHGNIMHWVAKKIACDKAGIKYRIVKNNHWHD